MKTALLILATLLAFLFSAGGGADIGAGLTNWSWLPLALGLIQLYVGYRLIVLVLNHWPNRLEPWRPVGEAFDAAAGCDCTAEARRMLIRRLKTDLAELPPEGENAIDDMVRNATLRRIHQLEHQS